MYYKALIVFLVVVALLSGGCRKDRFTTNTEDALAFNTDTLTFDTVFTALGSATHAIRIFNDSKSKILISNIELAGGSNSNFRINVDGIPGDAEDVEIWAEDSLYIFVEVTVDANNQNNPFIILDSILFETNGNHQKVVLMAWGQNAYYYNADSIHQNFTLPVDKPTVIFNYLWIDEGVTLNIDPATKIYFGGNSGLFIKGCLNVQGTKEDPAIFRHIRLESFYDDLPGQWLGLFFLRDSRCNHIKYAEISNSDYGISVGSSEQQIDEDHSFEDVFNFGNMPYVLVENTIVKNSFRNCISGFLSEIDIYNCIMYKAGDNLASFSLGGFYSLQNNTLVNYGSSQINHQSATLLIANGIEVNGVPVGADIFFDARNTLIYGSLDNEVTYSIFENAADNIKLSHCLVKSEIDTPAYYFNDVIFNQDPLFTDRGMDDYSLTNGSPCIDAGTTDSLNVSTDFNGNPHINEPDIGALEYIQ